ncbi:MAG: type II toxin-antitoxin system death-on-curing family toxin [Bacteroidota bacterium]|nr:type II toxin-antitoxin system death-on-curing family toxin [Bacteroidota bacterium]
MITLFQAEQIHNILIDNFGGTKGIRDQGGLLSALSRPFQTFEGKDLYETTVEKAAALLESMLQNHPFVDGNKRTGYVLMRLLLLENGYDIEATQDEKYDFVISVASGKIQFDEIVQWLNNHLIRRNGV